MSALAATSRKLGRSLQGAHAWVIVADGEIDQIVGSEREAKREARDLREMGCTVKVRQFDSWHAAEDYADKVRGY